MESDITEKKVKLLKSAEELKRITLELCEPINSIENKIPFLKTILEKIEDVKSTNIKKQKRNEVKLMNSYYRRMK
ncbi:MAG: hypothetical protein WC877_01790 [Dehalococcoidales bacterium]|jgi:hypothetical protein